MKNQFDAAFTYYLLDLFEGKISYNEIMDMDLNILLEFKKLRENKLEEQLKNQKQAIANAILKK